MSQGIAKKPLGWYDVDIWREKNKHILALFKQIIKL
jgi:hypothetical protein